MAKTNGKGEWAVECIGSHGIVTLKVVTPAGKNGMPMSVEEACAVVDALITEIRRAKGDEDAKATWKGAETLA